MRTLLCSCLIGFFSSLSFAGPPQFKKVFIVVLENASFDQAMAQPFLALLAQKGALLTNYSAIRHPSYPNYVAMTSGSTQGINSDLLTVIKAPHIGDLLEAKGMSWKNYAEDYRRDCGLHNYGRFAARHVPFLSYADMRTPARCGQHVVNSSELDLDIANDQIPVYSFYSPNLDNDGHDTSAKYASTWLEKEFKPRLMNQKFMKDMLFVVTFDEDDDHNKNRVYTVLLGSSVMAGKASSNPNSHYSLLRTIEEVFGLGTLNTGDRGSHPITGIWN